MTLQIYANLGVRLNGTLLEEQCGVVIDDHVNRRCRVTVTSAVPESGLEVDARQRLGELVKVSVHIVRRAALKADEPSVMPPLVEIEGPIVSSSIVQDPGKEGYVRTSFTVEQGCIAPEYEQ